MFNIAKKFDPVYKLEVCEQVESGATTVPEISKVTSIPMVSPDKQTVNSRLKRR
jgi:hypothetical protein